MFACLGGCAALPPGSSFPKSQSLTLSDPDTTRFGSKFAGDAREHGGRSGFRIFNVGVDGLLMRLEMINAAERTLDLQYYIFRGDESGRLVIDALARAAQRGVRVRLLVDDGETMAGDEQVLALNGRGPIEVRIFNPWSYRGHGRVLRGAEYLLRHSRLDYRMHNKLLLVDGAVALAGGRNVGDQYFQIDPESQFADDDVFAAGPITTALSAKFDEFWNSALAIPVDALVHHRSNSAAASSPPAATKPQKAKSADFEYQQKLATGEPLAGILSGHSPLVWADAQFVADGPDKKAVLAGSQVGDLMYKPVAQRATQVSSDLLVVTPYFVPTKDELQLLESQPHRGVAVRVLTNSLESNPDVAAHAGYTHYRHGLLQNGVQLHEVRSRLGDTRGSGQSGRLSRYGNYALHAKLYIFDRRQLYIGSMNLDSRSRRLNTEMGLIIDNAELAGNEAARFDSMTRPENSYSVELASGGKPATARLLWRTKEGDESVEYTSEPARSAWQRIKARLLSWLPLDPEL